LKSHAIHGALALETDFSQKTIKYHMPQLTNYFFKQIQQHNDNFSYIIADQPTMQAAVVDSSFNANEIIKIIKTNKFEPNNYSLLKMNNVALA
jgi:hypothetical protein